LAIADRLSYARSRTGLTLTQVRKRSQIGESSVSEFENGRREPSLSQLQALAAVYHRSVAFFLVEGEIPQETVLWREKPSEGGKDIETTFLRLCEQYRNLEIWTDEVMPQRLPAASGTAESLGYMQAEGLAKSIRDQLELGDRPALSLLLALEEECGVKVFHLDFEPTGTAASARSETFGDATLLNARNVRWRRNYDLAHELFHLLTWSIFRGGAPRETSVAASEQEEQLANCFASHLLMPAEAMRAAFGEKVRDGKLRFADVYDIARQFDVSAEAVLWRLFSLKLLACTRDDVYAIARRMTSSGGLYEERMDTKPMKWPERYKALAVRALHGGSVSIGRFAKYLEISRQAAMAYTEQEATDGEEVPLAPA